MVRGKGRNIKRLGLQTSAAEIVELDKIILLNESDQPRHHQQRAYQKEETQRRIITRANICSTLLRSLEHIQYDLYSLFFQDVRGTEYLLP